MAIFSNNDITDLGRGLLADVQMGAVFTPTRIVLGSGYMPSGMTPRTIKDVVNAVKSLTINKKKRTNDGLFICGGSYSNADITTSFYYRELALYAKAVRADGTETAEVLYCYGNAGDTADLMPSYSTGSPVERQIDVAAYIGNDSAVNLTIESGVFMTQAQFNEKFDEKFSEMWSTKTPDLIVSADHVSFFDGKNAEQKVAEILATFAKYLPIAGGDIHGKTSVQKFACISSYDRWTLFGDNCYIAASASGYFLRYLSQTSNRGARGIIIGHPAGSKAVLLWFDTGNNATEKDALFTPTLDTILTNSTAPTHHYSTQEPTAADGKDGDVWDVYE